MGDFFPNVRPVAALKTRVWVTQGRLDDALAWARQQGLSAAGRPQLPARVRAPHPGPGAPGPVLRRDRADRSLLEALGLLERLLHAAEDGGRTGSAIDILVLQALAHQTHGDIPAALLPLQRR